jgi:hypothetical protein
MRCKYIPDANACCSYYQAQTGGIIPAFSGTTMQQRGSGIGSFLSGLFRAAIPILKNVGRKVLPRLARAGVRNVGDVITKRRKPAEAFVKHAGHEIEELIDGSIKGNKRKRPTPRASNRKVNKRIKRPRVGNY